MNYSEYKVTKITRGACECFFAKHHYLSQQGNTFRSGYYFGLLHKDKLIAATVFNTMSSQITAKGCFDLATNDQQGFFEIGRFSIEPDYDTDDLAAWFLKESARRFRSEHEVRALFAYADPAYETGEVYTDAGFTCYGLTAKRRDFYVKQDDGSFIKQNRGKTKDVKGEWRDRPQKLRFLLTYDEDLHTQWEDSRK